MFCVPGSTVDDRLPEARRHPCATRASWCVFVRLIVVCMDTWKNGRAAVNHIHLSKTAFKNEPKHAFKNEPKHAFKNDHLSEQREGERTTEHTRETRERGRRRKGRGQCRRTEPEAVKYGFRHLQPRGRKALADSLKPVGCSQGAKKTIRTGAEIVFCLAMGFSKPQRSSPAVLLW